MDSVSLCAYCFTYMAVLVFHCRKSMAQKYFARYLQLAVGVTDKMPQWIFTARRCLSVSPSATPVYRIETDKFIVKLHLDQLTSCRLSSLLLASTRLLLVL